MADIIIPNGYVNILMGLTSTNLDLGTSVWQIGAQLTVPNELPATDLFADAWDDNIRPITDGSVSLTHVAVVTDVSIVDTAYSLVGGASYGLAPPNVTVVLKKRTNIRGPHGRGFIFPYGHLDESAVDEAGTINPANVTDLNEAYNGWLDDCLAGVGIDRFVVLAREGSLNPPPLTPPGIQNFICSSKVSTQRRRLR